MLSSYANIVILAQPWHTCWDIRWSFLAIYFTVKSISKSKYFPLEKQVKEERLQLFPRETGKKIPIKDREIAPTK